MNTYESSNLDQEWVKLVKEAMKIGLSKDEIRSFFLKSAGLSSKGSATDLK